MKKKILAFVLAMMVVVSGAAQPSVVYADDVVAESGTEYYTIEASLKDGNGYSEITVGEYGIDLSFGVLDKDGNYLPEDQVEYLSDEDMATVFEDDNYSSYFYSSNGDVTSMEDDELHHLTAPISEKVFGKYIYKYVWLWTADEHLLMKLVRSDYRVTAWGGSGYTVSDNGDGKTVSVFSIWDTDKNAVTIKSKTKIGKKTYKVTEIGEYALEGNNVEKVIIPDTVTKIGKNAFNGASKLKTIEINGKIKKIGKNAFKGINKKAVFKIKASEKDYKKIVKLIKKSGVAKTVSFKKI